MGDRVVTVPSEAVAVTLHGEVRAFRGGAGEVVGETGRAKQRRYTLWPRVGRGGGGGCQ